MLIIRALQKIQNEHRAKADDAILNALEQTQKAIHHLYEMHAVCVGGDSVGDLIQELKDVELKLRAAKEKFNDTCFGHDFAVKGTTYTEALTIVKEKIEERIEDVTKNPDLIRPFANVDDDIPF